MIPDPLQLGLPHQHWRKDQLDAYQKSLSVYESGGGTICIEAPVGIGKSAIPTALGSTDQVLVLAHNHGLLHQYEEVYGFDIVMGKPEYPCVLDSKVDSWKLMYGYTPTAADCHFANMYDCPVSFKCPYVEARDRFAQSKRAACTYKYAALSEVVQKRTGIVVFDEAHDSYEELIEFCKFTIKESTAKDFKFPPFPLVNFGPGGAGDILEKDNRSKVISWIMQSMSKISIMDLFSVMTPDGAKNQRMFDQLSSALNMLMSDQILFFKCAKPIEYDDWRFDKKMNSELVLTIRSVDVRDLVKKITNQKKLKIMMSATIGNPQPLMNQLGFDVYKSLKYKHPVPVSKRPVYDLGIDKMTKANLDSRPGLYAQQANAIADFIESLNPEWRGIVLSTSNYKTNLLRKLLTQRLNGRVLQPTETSLSGQIKEFMMSKKKGQVAIGNIQGWGSGISLVGDIARYSVIAGVPFSNPGDRFDQLRMSTPEGKKYAFWNAYCSVVQGTGRVTRNELESDGTYMLNVAALADGSTTTPQAKGMYSDWFNEAIVSWQKN